MIKVSCIVMVGLVAAALLHRRSAAARHWILAAAILCAALTPAVELVVPSWHLPGRFLQITQRPAALPLYVLVRIGQSDDDAVAVSGGSTSPVTTMVRAVTILWMAGAVIGLAILGAGCARLVILTRRAQRLRDGLWVDLARQSAHEFQIVRPIAVVQSDHPTLCVTWGLLRPVVVLPRGADTWSAERARIVLSHEMAHVARHDWAIQMIAELLRAVYWYNPLLWVARNRLRRESEQACDDAVLALGVQGDDYATHLLELARTFSIRRHPTVPAPAMARPSSLERRVRAMLNTHVNRTPLTRSACALVVLALVLVTLPVASAQGGPATFSGSLMDAVGRVLPDITLKLTSGEINPKTGATTGQPIYQAVSDANGRFVFNGLPAGEYTMQVSKIGFATTQGRVTLGGGQHLDQDVALQIGALNESIVVKEPDPAATATAPTPRRAPATKGKTGDDPCSLSVVGGCITQPMKTVDVKPIYPAAFAGSGTSATVKFEARIGPDGLVNELHSLSQSEPEFIAAATDAIRQWQFTQTRLDGVPVEVKMIVMVSFAAR